ncbi:MAG: hypothetical protein HC873_11395 [Leptolyngbyaceae cyanobacterium SL_1_1]|nr:hypothetical protein [Leptolyngbyaceae cyanobacterium SL_1_1]
MAHLLAIAVGLGSFAFYMVAFFYPEVHRKSDFIWSGVGLFYGLVLWFCAGRITGALMLGQMSSTALVLVLGWQTLSLRRSRTPVALQTPVSSGDLRRQAQQVWAAVAKRFWGRFWNRLPGQNSALSLQPPPRDSPKRHYRRYPARLELPAHYQTSPCRLRIYRGRAAIADSSRRQSLFAFGQIAATPRCCGPGYSSGFYGLTAQISYPTSAPSQQTHHPQNLAQQDPPAPAPDQTAHDRAAATTAFDRAIAQTCRLKTYPLCPNGKVSARRHHRC